MADGVGLPGLADVVSLLYRADWTRLSLSGEVSGNDEPRTPTIAYVETVRPFTGDWARSSVLRVAPGGRCRRDSGSYASGSDGVRAWQWHQDMARHATDDHLVGAAVPPFRTLLCPSWLLTGYELSVMGRVTACGREGIRVTGTARPRLDLSYERVDAVIDAELGIMLRCERSLGGAAADQRAPEILEFARLDVLSEAHDAVFAPPPGSHVEDAKRAGRVPVESMPSFPAVLPPLASPGAKTAVGMAAGALGAALKFTPFGRVRTRHEDEIGEKMPDDDPPPAVDGAGVMGASLAWGPLVSDEILLLLYRSGAGIPRFTATLHTWTSGAGVLAGAPQAAREMGFGSVGHLVDAAAAQADVTTHEVSTARIDGWYRYQIERVPPLLSGRHHGPTLIACNRRRYWEVREDRVSIDEPRPAPAELADLADASWLLGCELTGGEAIMAGGRAAYRLTVRGNHSQSELLDSGFPAVAVVDAETGRLLRLTTYGSGLPACRHELLDVSDDASPDDGWDFAFEAPRDLRVVRIGADDDRPLKDGETAAQWPSRCRPGRRHRLGLRATLRPDLHPVLAQPLENRCITESEEINSRASGNELERRPGRHHDQVAMPELVLRPVDHGNPRSLEGLEHRGPDLAARHRRGARPQPVELRADRRQHVAPGRRVGKADRGVPRLDDARVALVLKLQLLAKGGVGVRPPVGRQRRLRVLGADRG
jgi:hypothetical protein